MTDETESLVLEHLRSLRAGQARLEDKMDTLAAEMIAMRQHQLGSDTLLNHDHDNIAALKARLERIEKRLDLVE